MCRFLPIEHTFMQFFAVNLLSSLDFRWQRSFKSATLFGIFLKYYFIFFIETKTTISLDFIHTQSGTKIFGIYRIFFPMKTHTSDSAWQHVKFEIFHFCHHFNFKTAQYMINGTFMKLLKTEWVTKFVRMYCFKVFN